MTCLKRWLAGFSAISLALTGTNAWSQSKVSDNVVRIGVLTDLSGQFSHESGKGAVTAVQMAVEDFGGKVLGVPIDVISADHLNKPDIAISKAREWFDTQTGGFPADAFLEEMRGLTDGTLSCPYLFIHGQHDNWMTLEKAIVLFEKARGMKEKIIIMLVIYFQ